MSNSALKEFCLIICKLDFIYYCNLLLSWLELELGNIKEEYKAFKSLFLMEAVVKLLDFKWVQFNLWSDSGKYICFLKIATFVNFIQEAENFIWTYLNWWGRIKQLIRDGFQNKKKKRREKYGVWWLGNYISFILQISGTILICTLSAFQ